MEEELWARIYSRDVLLTMLCCNIDGKIVTTENILGISKFPLLFSPH